MFAERDGFYGRYRAHVIKSDDLVIENGDIVIKFDDNIRKLITISVIDTLSILLLKESSR